MSNGFTFWTPANQQDFPNDPSQQATMNALWNLNLTGFTNQGITGDPWNSTNASGITNYFNPVQTPIPANAVIAPIQWNAFPGRIGAYNPQLTPEQVLSLGDTGYYTDENGQQQTFPPITTNPCTNASENLAYGPYGPRGWQDEYCEWSVQLDPTGTKILRVDITCENPEYWNTLWAVDPSTVLAIYQATLGKSQIQLADLYLYDSTGNVVIDPSTGQPAYNPLNIWNSGPVSSDTAGGAMHLTSTPNTLQTEIGLASAATIQRQGYSWSDPSGLICCAQYGQPNRNSDPHIGAMVNYTVETGTSVTLTNPPGLYIQEPNWSVFQTPDGTPAENFWTIVRGSSALNDVNGNQLPGNFILHASFAVPAEKKYTVSDIQINGQPIQWAGQIIQQLSMQILATAITAAAPSAVGCMGTPSTVLAQPLQLFQADVFNAMNAAAVSNPVGQPMTLLSNSTMIAPSVSQGAQNVSMVLTATTVGSDCSVSFDGDDITAQVTGSFQTNYAVPGNSYPGPVTAIQLVVNVAENAVSGLRALYLTNSGQSQGAAMPAMLNVLNVGSGDKK